MTDTETLTETLTETEVTARADIFEILSYAPGEVEGVRQALWEGRIDGQLYEGECCCLVGTIAVLRKCNLWKMAGVRRYVDSPGQQWFFEIMPGHTPENNERARITDGWLTEWLEMYGEQGEAENGQ